MAKDKKVRCVYCGAEITEIQSNNPQDYLHSEYEKYADPRFTDIKPRYCCSYCNGLTSINRALYNADKIEKYYTEIREKATKEDGGSNGKN